MKLNEIIKDVVVRKLLRVYEEEVEFSKYYGVVEEVEIEEEYLEFIDINKSIVIGFDIECSMCKEDENESYLIIVIEDDRVLYLIVDDEFKVIKEKEFKEIKYRSLGV